MLATSGGDPNDKLIGAIVLNIWMCYEKMEKNPSDLSCLVVDCEMGRLAVAAVAKKFLVCIWGNTHVEFGMLKSKVFCVILQIFIHRCFDFRCWC